MTRRLYFTRGDRKGAHRLFSHNFIYIIGRKSSYHLRKVHEAGFFKLDKQNLWLRIIFFSLSFYLMVQAGGEPCGARLFRIRRIFRKLEDVKRTPLPVEPKRHILNVTSETRAH